MSLAAIRLVRRNAAAAGGVAVAGAIILATGRLYWLVAATLAAAVWAIGNHSSNPVVAGRDKSGVLVAFAAVGLQVLFGAGPSELEDVPAATHWPSLPVAEPRTDWEELRAWVEELLGARAAAVRYYPHRQMSWRVIMAHDLAIIGSGGAGFAAAIAASTRGLRVVMVERGTIGGTCVNVGCIPSKALLAAAEARHVAVEGRFPGIATTAGQTDTAGLIAGKSEIVGDLRKEKYEDLAADYGWEVRRGDARFVAGPALEVAGERIEAEQYLIATGAAPWAPPVPGLAEAGYLTSTSALELEELPGSLIVVGGNYVGLEMGQAFARLGSKVTLVEALDRLAPGEEPEISEVIAEVLSDEGVEVWASATLAGVSREDGKVTARSVDGREVTAEAILMATGRRPVTGGLDPGAVGVETGGRGEVVVDDQLRTANPRIWAAGDVTGAPQFVYVAGAHGTMVVDNAFSGAGRRVDYSHLPRVTFTTPNIAAVGLTCAEVGPAGLSCTCRVLPLAYVPRAIVNRDTRGLVKIVAEEGTGRVVGIHIAAANAGDAILAATYALEAGMTVDQLANTWAPYLTMAEGIKLAAQSFRTDIAKLSCCAA